MDIKTSTEQKISLIGIIIWVIAALFFLYEFFLRTFIGSLAPEIIPDLHLTPELFALLGAVYCLAYGGMQLPVGILLDKFGEKKVMAVAVTICAFATFGFALSHGFYGAIFSRFFMGIGSACAFVSLLAITLKWFPHRHFGLLAGLSQLIGTLGPILAGAPLIHILNTQHKTWHVALAQAGIFGLLLAVLIVMFVRNHPKTEKNSPLFQKRAKSQTKIKILLKNPQTWYIALYSGTIYVTMALLGIVWGTEFLIAKGFTQEHAALIISCTWVGYAIGCPLIGTFSDYQKRRKPSLIYTAIIGLISILTFILYPGPNIIIYILACFFIGVACSGQNIGFVTICEQVAAQTKAAAIGLNNGVISLFDFAVPIMVGVLIQHSAHEHLKHLYSSNFFAGFLILPILYLTAALLSIFLIKETHPVYNNKY